MIEHETSTNPYRPDSSDPKLTTPTTKALKYISHGIYLQLFLGSGMLMVAAIDVDTGPLFDGPKACGAMLIGLGLNSLIYIQRYRV